MADAPQCMKCGRFISYRSLDKGRAKYRFLPPTPIYTDYGGYPEFANDGDDEFLCETHRDVESWKNEWVVVKCQD